jgi:hypothetical protein
VALTFSGEAAGDDHRRGSGSNTREGRGGDGMECARDRGFTSALKENFEQFQGCNNDEEGGDNHEHGANPMPCMPDVIGHLQREAWTLD